MVDHRLTSASLSTTSDKASSSSSCRNIEVDVEAVADVPDVEPPPE